ncbi:MAG: DUF4252 domain-containing protein [Bacteroidaceae bacterium]|nr:DUF4252 domain-containing protein [Bacteroidaceae bacterium]
MKNLILVVILLFSSVSSVLAQGEEDFAASFMRLNAADHKLECITVSPNMMSRMLALPVDSVQSDSLSSILRQVKSIRVVNSVADEATIELLYEKAELLAVYSKLCYETYAKADDCTFYIRCFDDVIVELVMLLRNNNEFCIVNFTGNMDREFLQLIGRRTQPVSEPQENQ